MTQSKRIKTAKELIEKGKEYSLIEAIALVKEVAKVKFDASLEIHARLGIDPKKSEQVVRGAVDLPHGTGKKVRVAAFVGADKEAEAKSAGADIYGGKDLIEQIKKDSKCDFDVAVATPDIMKDLAVIARTLGQKGLMPNPKVGTVTVDIKKIVSQLKAGKANFRSDDTANVHLAVGKISFSAEQLADNIRAFIDALKKVKPETVKGTYLQSIYVCSSMGPSVKVEIKSI
jgi:large subunit ribosomal protein L1